MNRRQFLKTAAVCVATGATAQGARAVAAESGGKKVRGKVSGDSGPVSGVVVSDGLNCVRTDENGEFTLSYMTGVNWIAVATVTGALAILSLVLFLLGRRKSRD